jgi:ATP-dependent RNA helicase DeaD/ATP-dependent RNA helicase RhlE
MSEQSFPARADGSANVVRASTASFSSLGVSKPVVGALAARGFESPFAVQRLVIADVLAGRDVLAQSPTGSGKTLAFGVPMVDLISAEARRPAGLILAPTRELAGQIVDELQSVANARALSVAVVHGGVGLQRQAKLAARAHIVVATPGRLEDLLQRGDLTLKHVQLLVLDEADRMLDMGFKPPVDRIVAKIPKDHQTLFFSATLEGEVGKVARQFTRNPVRHVHEATLERKAVVDHRFVHLAHDAKRGADRLVKRLGAEALPAVAMHGNKSQSQRQKALARFESGDVTTLVATDVAARGIDVANITHVINFDAPEDRDSYVHRVGRTARAGAKGAGVSFVLPEQSHDMRRIASDLGLTHQFEEGGPSHSGQRTNGTASPSGGRRSRGRSGGRGRRPR